jgi:predicted metal-dependent hydrolase
MKNASGEGGFEGKSLHPRALAGLRKFNAGAYFEAHEELEAAWLAEKGMLRDLYQGILQFGVACYHLERGNYAGALKVVRRSLERLASFQGEVLGIKVGQIKEDAARLEAYLAAGDWTISPPVVRAIVIR